MDKSKKKMSAYSFFIIPADNARVRKLHLSAFQLRLVGVVIGLVVLFAGLNTVGFWYYRYLHASFLKERAATKEFEKEKALLVQKVRQLENAVDNTEEYAGKLAGLVGTERPRLKKGIGPLPSARLDLMETTQKIDTLEEKAVSLEERIKDLYEIQEDKVLYIAATPSIWPVKGWVTSDFGSRHSPLNYSPEFHEGIDIAAQYGTPVLAAADGVVTYATTKGGLGKTVILDHGFGIASYYGHNSALFVHEGQRVKRGTKIALTGNTGHSTGPHLHYEIHVDGVPVDPMKYILQ